MQRSVHSHNNRFSNEVQSLPPNESKSKAKFASKAKTKRNVFLAGFSSSIFLFMTVFLFASWRHFDNALYQPTERDIDHVEPLLTPSSKSNCSPKMGLWPVTHRRQLATIAEKHGLKSGIEIGVKEGAFAKMMLRNWKSCEKYHLVDLWAQQTNYKDAANVDNTEQEQFYQRAQTVLGEYKNKTEFHRMLSTEASKKFEKESIDFIYVDARHDYCGVKEDLEHYWPILKPGGIIAGHDYHENSEVRNQDWGLCADGTRNEMAVKGAVNDFFLPKGLTISLTDYGKNKWFSWMVQKPLC